MVLPSKVVSSKINMAQKISDNIVKIALAIVIAAITYFGHTVMQDHDTITAMGVTWPEMREQIKELAEHRCNCATQTVYNKLKSAKELP